ncbi:MAG: MFS transporter [Candidatus Methanofastidiosia archaeon]
MFLRSYFSKFGKYSQVTFSLCLLSTILNIGFGVMIPYLPLFARRIGASPTQVGFVISSFMIGRAISASTFGKRSDIVGRKPMIISGVLAFGLTSALMVFSFNWVVLSILRFLQGFAAGIAWPMAEALLVDSVPPKIRGEALGIYVSTLQLGFFLGPGVGGLLYFLAESLTGSALLGYSIPLLFTGIFAFIAAFYAKSSIKDVYVGVEKMDESFELEIDEREVRRDIFSFYGVSFCNGFALGLIIPIFALLFVDVLELKPALLGMVMMVGGSVGVFMNPFTGILADRIGRKPLTVFGLTLSGIVGVLFGFVRTLFETTSIFVLRSFSFAFYFPAFRALQANTIPPQIRGRVMGRIQASFNMGAVVGPMVGTYLYELFLEEKFYFRGHEFLGAAIPFALTSLLMFSSALTVFLVTKER